MMTTMMTSKLKTLSKNKKKNQPRVSKLWKKGHHLSFVQNIPNGVSSLLFSESQQNFLLNTACSLKSTCHNSKIKGYLIIIK